MLNGTRMQLERARTTTSLSWFLVPLAIAGCLRVESTGADPDPRPDAFVHGTSLDGTIRCGSMQCPSGTLCTHWASGIDAGVTGDNVTCTIVPTSCAIRDCHEFAERCSPCISQLCSGGGATSSGYGVSVTGRDLYCPGV